MMTSTYVHRLRAGAPGKPTFFVFHGTGGDENQFFDFASQLLPEATIVSPRGDVTEHGAARFFRRTGEGVYDMDDLARATTKMVGYVKSLADEHKASAVIGLGFSNGANILANVLIEEGKLFDASVLMHPLIPFEPRDNAGLAGSKVLITAGARDPIAPASLTKALADYFVRQKADATLEWHPGGHDIRPNEIDAVRTLLAAYA
ncbi:MULTISPECIES: alpha/beta hydrolase [unclassified Rhizobium]|uniref:alpha/beta hydrolase n=2 Tax=unclassified Rhizobium TaxID=2613769 RepID=UPI001ADC1498|nr:MULTISPECIES: alpha/beta hydrolase [unclassified Rhizobium]MBO9099278.1 alpha/beta hydrolase [Rhizobium sp. L58/93]MBO9169540.1 alpha/beta hydrolase [Rhizobium sp. L245/93]MBO9185491.1 alpha/beta hydrolase [Rhizobium sp. E27B/91]MBO9131916.1 alpha/beta hydrolase [Rhizobium sp. B209b/85]QXZ85827.1 alpha/beta hydrolase [Rhizobium sp. K1/93]